MLSPIKPHRKPSRTVPPTGENVQILEPTEGILIQTTTTGLTVGGVDQLSYGDGVRIAWKDHPEETKSWEGKRSESSESTGRASSHDLVKPGASSWIHHWLWFPQM